MNNTGRRGIPFTMTFVVYLDLLVLINLLMNYILLWATAKLSNLSYKVWRLFITSLLGTGYTILVILPQFSFLNRIPVHLLISGIMIIIAFAPLTGKDLIKAVSYFYLITFVTAGAMFALYNMTGKTPLDSLAQVLKLSPDNLWLIICGVLLVIIIGKFGWRVIQQKLLPNIFYIPIEISFGGANKEIMALVDTGNQLRDPLTNTPVIVVEAEAILELMPQRIKEGFRQYNYSSDQLLEEVVDTDWADRFRLIPFSSIGKEQGMLVGFRPDEVVIKTEDRTFTTQQVVIGLQSNSLDNSANYQALLNPQIFKSAHC